MGATCRRAFVSSPSWLRPLVAVLAVLQAMVLLAGAAAARPLLLERVAVGGAIRDVWVHVPVGLDADPTRPLVIAFHGGGSHVRAMAERTGLQRTADDPDAVVLILVVGGGHTWPGSTPRERWLGPSTLDIDANELMWAYFEPRSAPPRARPASGSHAAGTTSSPRCSADLRRPALVWSP